MQKICLYVLFLLFFSVKSTAQSVNSEYISLPKGAVWQQLSNGFEYIIMPNEQPKGRVEVRLCLRVGSFQEEKGEEGIAHFIEHLAFSGSKYYPQNTALKFWESLGAKYGENINAYTTDDRTVYSISLSRVNATQIAQTIHILSDWLNAMNLSTDDIEKERKIVTQEIASYKPYKELHPIKVGDNPSLIRLPIGTKTQIAKVTPDRLRSFYEKWYNPQNASLIVVGDINVESTEKAIKTYFGTLLQRGGTVAPLAPIPFAKKELFATEKGKGKRAKLSLLYPIPYKNSLFITNQAKDVELPKVFVEILNNRFRAQKEDIHISEYWYLRGTSFLEIEMTSENIERTLKKAFAIIEGAKTSLTEEEVNKALEKITTSIEKIPQERTSEDWALSFIDSFIFRERFISQLKDKEKLIKEINEKHTLSYWQDSYSHILNFLPSPILLFTPADRKYTHRQLRQFIREGVLQPDTTPATFKEGKKAPSMAIPELLSQEIPYQPQFIKKETFFKEIGVHSIELTNGATIYLKPTENDEKLNITLLFKGGYSLLPQKTFKQYEDILQYVHLGGIEGLRGEAYEEALYHNELTFIVGTEGYHHLAMATAPIDKSKELCNLIYQKLRYPERAYEAFDEVKSDEIRVFSQRKAEKKPIDPIKQLAFEAETLKGATYRLTLAEKTMEDIQRMDLDTLYNYYQSHFLSPNGLLCVVTGSFEVEKLKKELVGTLSKIVDRKEMAPEEDKSIQKSSFQTLKVTQNKRTTFHIIYKDSYQKSLRNVLALKLFKDLVRKEVIAEIREKKGWVYTPYVEMEYYSDPTPTFALVVSGETEEKHLKEIEISVHHIIHRIRQEKHIDKKALTDLKHSFMINKNEYLSNENAYNWRTYLIDCFKNKALEELPYYEKILESIDEEALAGGK